MKKLFYLLFVFRCAGAVQALPCARKRRKFTGTLTVYNVVNYGATASVVTGLIDGRVAQSSNKIDAKTGIQAAINAAHAGGGGIVYFPPGHYYTTQFESYTDVKLLGDGYVAAKIHGLGDTIAAIHNLLNAIAGTYQSSFANTLAEGLGFEGDSLSKFGLYIDRAANFKISRCQFTNFTSTGSVALTLRDCLIGEVADCYLWFNYRGIYGYADGTNNTAVTHVAINNTVINFSKKWALEWGPYGGHLSTNHCDFEVNGTNSDTLTGAVYYHGNTWPFGYSEKDAWYEQNFGNETWLQANVNNTFQNYPIPVTHAIFSANRQGHNNDLVNRNIKIDGSNQRLAIYSSTVFGAQANIVIDGTNNTVVTYASTFKTPSVSTGTNTIRGTGNTITNN